MSIKCNVCVTLTSMINLFVGGWHPFGRSFQCPMINTEVEWYFTFHMIINSLLWYAIETFYCPLVCVCVCCKHGCSFWKRVYRDLCGFMLWKNPTWLRWIATVLWLIGTSTMHMHILKWGLFIFNLGGSQCWKRLNFTIGIYV